MLDEGVAREVVNRIQRLRKKVQCNKFSLLTCFSSCSSKTLEDLEFG